MMERLTQRNENGIDIICLHYGEDERMCYGCPRHSGCTEDLLNRLAYYEDMEEQGRLALPCKPGDKVYRVVRWGKKNHVEIRERIIHAVEYNSAGEWVIHSTGSDVLGERAFLTREEAEQALSEKVYEQVQDAVDQHNREAMRKIAAFIEPKEGAEG